MNINTPVINIKNISGDNSQFTENTVPTIKSHQLNLDGQEVTIRAGSVIPANIAKVHGEIMLDLACCKNLCISGYKGSQFECFNKLYYNYNAHRLEVILGNGTVVGSPTFTTINVGESLREQQEGNVLMALAAHDLLSYKMQIPKEAVLAGRPAETAKAVGTGTLANVMAEL